MKRISLSNFTKLTALYFGLLLPAAATPIIPGVPLLQDQQFQQCLDEAISVNGWTTTEQVNQLTCQNRNIEHLDGIQLFTSLIELDIKGNQVYSIWPLEQLPQLEILDLSDNQLIDAYSLPILNQLQQLSLSGNPHLESLLVQSVIQNNPNLTHLGVAQIAMGNDLNWLPPRGPQGEYNLLELDISHTGQYFDLYPLVQYTNLRRLKAAGVGLEFPMPLEQLTQLELVDLSDNRLFDAFPLEMLNNLKELKLSGNSKLQATQVQTIIQNNPSLTHLGVAQIAMGDNLSWLPSTGPLGEYNFVELDISNTGQLSDLYPVLQYPNLKSLKAADLNLAYPASFAAGVPLQQFEVLDLSNNQLVDVAPLQTLHNLKLLNLSGNSRLSATQVQPIIQNNPRLTHLAVAQINMGNDLNWLPPRDSSDTYHLVELDISQTGQFFDLNMLHHYSNLRVLKAAGIQLQFSGPLDQLTQLEELDLSNNLLFDAYPLHSLQNLYRLNLSGNTQLTLPQIQTIIQNNHKLTHLGVAQIAMGNDLNWLPPRGPLGEYNLIELDISQTGQLFDLYPLTQYTNLKTLKAAGVHLEFPMPLDQLSQLEIVDLSDNQLFDAYPLQMLNNLQQLNLSGNTQIQADQVQTIIQNNPGLTHLGLAHIAMGNHLNWLPTTGPLGEYNLIELDISHSGQLFDLHPLTQHHNLQVLRAAGLQLEIPAGLEQLTQLQILDLSSNQLIDVNPLQILPNLKHLDLSGNAQLQADQVRLIIQNNPGLTHLALAQIAMGNDLNWLPPSGPQGEYTLVELDISHTGQLLDLYPLTQYTNLKVLKAVGLQLQFPVGIEQLNKLEALDLSENQLVDASVLDMLYKLKKLNLSRNTQLPAFQVQSIIQNNPGLTHLGVAEIAMGNNLFWLPTPGSFGEYNLIELDISHTGQLFDLYQLSLYASLKILKTAGNQLQVVHSLDQLQQLNSLDLSNNHLQQVWTLGNIPSLVYLDLRGNNTIQCHDLDALEQMLVSTAISRPENCIFLNPPTITLESPFDATQFFATDSIQFLANANDIEDGNLDSLIKWTSDIDGEIGSGATFNTPLNAGNHLITAAIIDSDGNAASSSVTLTVLPNTAPQLSYLSPLGGTLINQGDFLLLSAQSIDTEDGNISAAIQWSSSLDGILGTGSEIQSLLSAGIHIITASITDSAGVKVEKTATVSVNNLPQLNLQSPVTGNLYMLQELVKFQANANDVEDGEISANIEWSSNIDGALGTGSILIKNLSLGTHILTASITDSAGASMSVSREVIIDQIDLLITTTVSGNRKIATLTWSNSRTLVDIYKNGRLRKTAADMTGSKQYRFRNTAVFKVCETGTNYCSADIIAQ